MGSKIVAGMSIFAGFLILGFFIRTGLGWVLGWLAGAITGISHIADIPITSLGVIVAILSLLWTVSISSGE